jgi:septum site-determining protein MinD
VLQAPLQQQQQQPLPVRLPRRAVRVAAAADNGAELTEKRVIVVTSGKGGVGKTTACANLGMSIARLGYKVALIDADIGLRNLDLLLGLENRVLYTAIDILEGECRWAACLR